MKKKKKQDKLIHRFDTNLGFQQIQIRAESENRT